jgi:hypothetical protein
MTNKFLITSFLCFLLTCCTSKDNQNVHVTVLIIDSYTKKPRIHDKLEVKIAKWGFPTRRYVEIGKYFTNSSGAIYLSLDKNERYSFMSFGDHNAFGSDEYAKGELKNNQKIIINVVPPDKKEFKSDY